MRIILFLFFIPFLFLSLTSKAVSLRDDEIVPAEYVFDVEQEKNNQEAFTNALMTAPCDVYEQLLSEYKKNKNFSFPAAGYALAIIEAKLVELISQDQKLIKAEQIISQLVFLKESQLPYQLTKELLTEAIFYLQEYFDLHGQLVRNEDVQQKYHKTQNYDLILGEFGKSSYNNDFSYFYLSGELDITFFNRVWHLPFSPLEVSIKPINLFDFSVGGPRCVISHDRVHDWNKSYNKNIRKREILVVKLNEITHEYRKSSESLESVINAIELIRFFKGHEVYRPCFGISQFACDLKNTDKQLHLMEIITSRIQKGEFSEKYNVATLRNDLEQAFNILIKGLSST